MTAVTDIPGLQSLTKEDGGWQGWVWATEIEHDDFAPILAKFGENRIELEADTDGIPQPGHDGLDTHMPISEIQINLFVGDDGRQMIDVVAIVEGFVAGEGLVEETWANQVEYDIFDFFENILGTKVHRAEAVTS